MAPATWHRQLGKRSSLGKQPNGTFACLPELDSAYRSALKRARPNGDVGRTTRAHNCCPMNGKVVRASTRSIERRRDSRPQSPLHFRVPAAPVERGQEQKIRYRSSYCIKLIPIWPKIKKIKKTLRALYSVFLQWQCLFWRIFLFILIPVRPCISKFISTRLEIILAIIKSFCCATGPAETRS